MNYLWTNSWDSPKFSRWGGGFGGGGYDAPFWKVAIGIVVVLIVVAIMFYEGCGVDVDRECHNGTRLYTPGTFKEKWCIKEKNLCTDYDDDGFSHTYTCWETVKCWKVKDQAVRACETGRY